MFFRSLTLFVLIKNRSYFVRTNTKHNTSGRITSSIFLTTTEHNIILPHAPHLQLIHSQKYHVLLWHWLTSPLCVPGAASWTTDKHRLRQPRLSPRRHAPAPPGSGSGRDGAAPALAGAGRVNHGVTELEAFTEFNALLQRSYRSRSRFWYTWKTMYGMPITWRWVL